MVVETVTERGKEGETTEGAGWKERKKDGQRERRGQTETTEGGGRNDTTFLRTGRVNKVGRGGREGGA